MEQSKAKLGLLITTTEHTRYGESARLEIILRVIKVIEGDKVRNLIASSGEDQCADLIIRGLLFQDYASMDAEAYFSDCYRIELCDAERMARVLKKLKKGLDKLSEQYGHARDFGAQVARMATVLGIDCLIQYREKNGTSYDDSTYKFLPIGYGADKLNGIVADWRERHPLPIAQTVA